MPRILHGQVIPVNTVEVAADILGGPESAIAQEVQQALKDDLRAFAFLFPALQNDPNNLLPETPDTRDHLVLLGQTMRDPGPSDETNPGESKKGPPPPLDFIAQLNAGPLTDLCISSGGATCIQVLPMDSSTSATGSSNSFAIFRGSFFQGQSTEIDEKS